MTADDSKAWWTAFASPLFGDIIHNNSIPYYVQLAFLWPRGQVRGNEQRPLDGNERRALGLLADLSSRYSTLHKPDILVETGPLRTDEGAYVLPTFVLKWREFLYIYGDSGLSAFEPLDSRLPQTLKDVNAGYRTMVQPGWCAARYEYDRRDKKKLKSTFGQSLSSAEGQHVTRTNQGMLCIQLEPPPMHSFADSLTTC